MNPDEFRRSILAKRADAKGEKGKTSPLAEARNLVGSLLGAALGWYCGVIFLVPFVASLAVTWAARTLFKQERKRVLPAFGIQGGQFIWLLVGALLQHRVDTYLLDMAWLLGGLIWLAARPGLLPVCLLAVYQLISLAEKVPVFIHAQVGTPIHKALLVHLIWHVLALGALGILFAELRKRKAGAEVTETGSV